jgi:hypothetical protein
MFNLSCKFFLLSIKQSRDWSDAATSTHAGRNGAIMGPSYIINNNETGESYGSETEEY